MNNFTSVMAGVALLLGLQGLAWAEEHEGGEKKPRGMMEKADSNKDGKVSYDEFKAFHETKMQEHFKKEDLNGDGSLDKEEVKKAREMHRQERKERREERREKREGKPE
jgi:Ca2+-binding EF-hand superfamily protein